MLHQNFSNFNCVDFEGIEVHQRHCVFRIAAIVAFHDNFKLNSLTELKIFQFVFSTRLSLFPAIKTQSSAPKSNEKHFL